jgi:hypothetical protein
MNLAGISIAAGLALAVILAAPYSLLALAGGWVVWRVLRR